MALSLVLLVTLIAFPGAGFSREAGVMTPEKEAKLHAIQEAIEASGADWVAIENPIFLLPHDEYLRMLGGVWPPEVKAIFDTLRPRPEDLARSYPTSWDWREMEGTTSVKDQGDCGSCWDFAAVGATEGNLRINEGVALDLSEQQGLDCNTGYSSCDGGWPGDAYNVFRDPGAVSEQCMPYLGAEGNCRQRLCENVAIIDGFQNVAGNVDSYKAALMNGPISTCFSVYEDFDSYGGGCYTHTWGAYEAGHCITIVGWDDSMCGGQGAWICKNSWGGFWGVSGYFYIKYGECGIGNGAQRPLNAHIPSERLVPDEYSTIQNAIDNAQRGDVIRVAGGTYEENLVLGDYVSLYGGYDPTFTVRDPDAYPTVIDAGGSGSGIAMSSRGNIVIDGFHIESASGAGSSGVSVVTSEATIRNCEIDGCYRGISVSGNTVDGDVIVELCAIHDNAAAGVYLNDSDNTSVRIAFTDIHGNGDDGVYSMTSPVDVVNSTVSLNGGDGIDLRSSTGNVIYGSILVGNSGWGIVCTSATPTATYNDVWDNTAGEYSGLSAGSGSISEDPIFCDAAGGDLRIHATSPVVGAGQSGENLGALGIGCPPGPRGVSVVQNGAELDIAWSPPPPEERADVDHYVVYRDTTLYPLTAIGNVQSPDTTFTDITVPACVTQNYWVSAVDVEGVEGAVSDRETGALCYAGPQDLDVTFDEGGNELTWQAAEGAIDHYVITRSSITSPADSVGSTPADVTTFIDISTAACPRDNYTYSVDPVYDTGWKGQPSEFVSIDPTASPPSGLRAEWSGTDVILTWSPNCEGDFRRYWVYRHDAPFSPPINYNYLIGFPTDTTYVDSGLDPSSSYFYRLAASDASQEKSTYSEMVWVGSGSVLTVPSPYPTIQAAIDSAAALDTVVVSPGIYNEHVTMKDAVSLMSAGGRDETVIRSATGSVVSVGALSDLTVLSGFTIDGQGTATGLSAWASYLRVEGCSFENCASGIAFQFGGSPVISGNEFAGNQYGISVADSSHPFLSGNLFDGNSTAAITVSGSVGPEVGRTLADANDFENMGSFEILNFGTGVVDADYNWWGSGCPEAGWFLGSVDYTPWTDAEHSGVYTECTGVDNGALADVRASYNYPNPFNPKTAIRYEIPTGGHVVRLEVYDLRGRLVKTLVSEEQGAGEHIVVWDGHDESGAPVGSGVYFYRLSVGDQSVERKMVLLK
jgi:parallel beta-helix repeat protein